MLNALRLGNSVPLLPRRNHFQVKTLAANLKPVGPAQGSQMGGQVKGEDSRILDQLGQEEMLVTLGYGLPDTLAALRR